MNRQEFVKFCRDHGACNVDMDGAIEVSFALDLLSDYYMENPDGVIPTLNDVYKQIEMIHKITQ